MANTTSNPFSIRVVAPGTIVFEPAITGEPQVDDQYRTVDDRNTGNGGISYRYYNSRLKLAWQNVNQGDYTGTSGGVDVAQGGAPFGSGAVASGVGYKTFDATELVRRAVSSGINRGFYLTMTGSNGPSVTWGGRLSANPPTLQVVTDIGTFDCPCILSTAIVAQSVSSLPLVGTSSFTVSSSRRGVVQFDLGGVNGSVQSATLSLYATALYGSGRVLDLYELRPPTFILGCGSHTPVLGLAAAVGENNLAAADGTPAHPDVYCAGHFEGTQFPSSMTANAPRIKGFGSISYTNTVQIVPDPEAPGTSYWRGTAVNVVPGSTGRGLFKEFYQFTPADRSDSRFPIDVSQKVEECYVRIYFMMESDWADTAEGIKMGIGITMQFGYWVPNSTPPNYGYWQPHGGNSNSYGDGLKHYGDCHDSASPYQPVPINPNYYFHQDLSQYTYKGCMQFNLAGVSGLPTDPHWDVRPLQGYNYNIDATDVYGEGQSTLANLVNSRIRLGRWYCFEQYAKMNTVDKTQPIYGAKDGSFYDNYVANADGIHRTWLNGVLIDEKSAARGNGFRWRQNEEMGIQGAGIEWYTGGNGTTNWPNPAHFRVSHVVVAKKYIGPRVRP